MTFLDLAARGRPRRIAGKPSLADLKELLGPTVVKALRNPLAPAQLRDAMLATQAVQHDADLLLGRVLLPRRTADLSHDPLGQYLGCLGFLFSSPLLHRATMSQKSSLPQPARSVSRVLTADRDGHHRAVLPGGNSVREAPIETHFTDLWYGDSNLNTCAVCPAHCASRRRVRPDSSANYSRRSGSNVGSPLASRMPNVG